jgi:hypothetical protein
MCWIGTNICRTGPPFGEGRAFLERRGRSYFCEGLSQLRYVQDHPTPLTVLVLIAPAALCAMLCCAVVAVINMAKLFGLSKHPADAH